MRNRKAILAAVNSNPGIGVAGLAEALGIAKPNARRDALNLVDRGELRAEATSNGYAFYPAENSRPIRETKSVPATKSKSRTQTPSLSFMNPGRQENLTTPAGRKSSSPIDCPFVDVTDSRLAAKPPVSGGIVVHKPPPTGRVLIPAGRRAPEIPDQIARMWDMLAITDPDGALTEAAQHRLRLRQIEEEHRTRLRAKELAEARQRPPEPTSAELWQAAGKALVQSFEAWQNFSRSNAQARAEVAASKDDSQDWPDRVRTRRRDPLRELLGAKRVTKKEPAPEAEPSWLERFFGAPSKAIWR